LPSLPTFKGFNFSAEIKQGADSNDEHEPKRKQRQNHENRSKFNCFFLVLFASPH
jgi:hypothetical protein